MNMTGQKGTVQDKNREQWVLRQAGRAPGRCGRSNPRGRSSNPGETRIPWKLYIQLQGVSQKTRFSVFLISKA